MILNAFKLDGKVALVTGVSTGLGKAMAIGLAQAGADIAGVYNNTPPDNVANEISKTGQRFFGLKFDLIDPGVTEDVIKKCVEKLGRLDILVNNAGIIRRSPALEFMEKDWDDVMDINAKSLFFLCKHAAEQFIFQKSRGKIINIASMLSFQGGIKVASYTASKSSVLGITRILANEWAGLPINVNAIAPGYMRTNNTKPLQDDQVRNKAIVERIPAGDWGMPEDLQGAVVFLASDASNYVHGHTLAVDGGWLAR